MKDQKPNVTKVITQNLIDSHRKIAAGLKKKYTKHKAKADKLQAELDAMPKEEKAKSKKKVVSKSKPKVVKSKPAKETADAK